MKWVRWLDFKGHGKGAQAVFEYKGTRYTHFFTGNKKQAMQNAFVWALKKRKELGAKFSTHGPRSSYNGKRKKNVLPVGVSIQVQRKNKQKPFAVAYANLNNKQHKIYFSFAMYGKRNAIARAIKQRMRWVEECESGLIGRS